jgi:DNA gyrase subunit A
VTLIALDEGTRLSGLQRIIESDAENGNGHADPVVNPAGDAGPGPGPSGDV